MGSPVDLPDQPEGAMRPDFATMFDGEVPWWRPGAWDVAKSIGWLWLLLAPIVFLLGATIFGVCAGYFAMAMLAGYAKVVLFLIAAAASIVLYGARHVVTKRRDDFCIHCGYSLSGLPENGTCPECGRRYLRSLIAEFRKDPHFFAERYKNSRRLPRGGPVFVAGDGPTPDDGTG